MIITSLINCIIKHCLTVFTIWNSTLVFNSSNKRFISSAGEVDSTELNILVSGKKFLFASTGEIIKEDELVDFMSFLYKTPMIGATYPTGKKIYDLINSLYLRFSLTDKSDKMPKEYLIPCFVADCCKCIGFEGIKYYGSKEYNNYVVWDDGFFDYAGMCS